MAFDEKFGVSIDIGLTSESFPNAKKAADVLEDVGEKGKNAGQKIKDGADHANLSHRQLHEAIRLLGPEFEGVVGVMQAGGAVWLGGLALIAAVIGKIKERSDELKETWLHNLEAIEAAQELFEIGREEASNRAATRATEYLIHQQHLLDGINLITQAYERNKAAISAAATEEGKLVDAQEKAYEIQMRINGATDQEIEDLKTKAERHKQDLENAEKTKQISAQIASAGQHEAAAGAQGPVIAGLQGAMDQNDRALQAAKDAAATDKDVMENARKAKNAAELEFRTRRGDVDALAQGTIDRANASDSWGSLDDHTRSLLTKGLYDAIKSKSAADSSFNSAQSAFDTASATVAERERQSLVLKADLEASLHRRDSEAEIARSLREQADEAERLLGIHKQFQGEINDANDDATRTQRRAGLPAGSDASRIANEGIAGAHADLARAVGEARSLRGASGDQAIPVLKDAVSILEALTLNQHASAADLDVIKADLAVLRGNIFTLQARQANSRTP
jgi:hypothetical protein